MNGDRLLADPPHVASTVALAGVLRTLHAIGARIDFFHLSVRGTRCKDPVPAIYLEDAGDLEHHLDREQIRFNAAGGRADVIWLGAWITWPTQQTRRA